MQLKREQSFQRLRLRAEVEQVDGQLPVNLVHQMVPLRGDGVVMPLGGIDLHRLTLRDEPFFVFRVDHHALAVLHQDAAPFLAIDHAVVCRCRMNVALITAH